MKAFKQRLAALEALEAAQQPELLAYVCLHTRDAAALDDLATLAEVRAAIVEDYRLGGEQQKLYIGICMCWGAESCRVCRDEALVGELST